MKTQKTIAVINLKGGCGRSTLSTNLAGELAKRGSTVLIDTDLPQGTSASWYALREQAGKAQGLALDTATSHQELIDKVSHRQEQYIVLDSPPRLAEIARAMLMLSDLVLIPVATSAAEVWATGDLVELLAEARKVRPVEARMVWARHRANTKLAKELVLEVENILQIPLLKTPMGLRVGYQEALGLGLTGTEVGDANAKNEVVNLTKEVLSLLGRSK